MADDELLVNIEKAFWPRGVMRGLTPALRALGDKNGNVVIAAQPTKGQIMVKGPADLIEKVKPGLLELIEEHFPDAPTPVELGGEGAGPVEEEEEEYEAPAPAPPPKPAASSPKRAPQKQPAPAPASPKRSPQKQPAPAPASPPRPAAAAPKKRAKPVEEDPLSKGKAPKVHLRRPRAAAAVAANAAPSLLWECMRKHSSFARPRALAPKAPRFSAEPVNLMGIHAYRYSGMAAEDALDVKPKKTGDKEAIELTLSHSRASRMQRPKSAVSTVGVSKCAKKGLALINREVGHTFYKRNLTKLARMKYLKIKQSFKKKKRTVKSRRARA